MTELIDYLIKQKGISTKFIDAWGQDSDIKREHQEKLLQSLGYDLQNEDILQAQLESELVDYWLRPIAPVIVCRVGESVSISIRVAIDKASTTHRLALTLESGLRLQPESDFVFVPVEHELVAVQEIDGLEWHEYSLNLPANCFALSKIKSKGGLGYHHLRLYCARKLLGQSRFIVCPLQCFMPSLIKKGSKLWGLSVQLYCLKSENNWGIGDFNDLNMLVQYAADVGADFIGLNPIHSLYPALPEICSPYGPNSRKWLNYLYISVPNVPGYVSEKVREWILKSDLQKQLDALRATEYIDYPAVAALKLSALKLSFKAFVKSANTLYAKQYADYKGFVKEGGDSLHHLCVYEALQCKLKENGQAYWGWPVFPEEFESVDLAEVLSFARKNKSLVDFFKFVQWQAAVQFEQASAATKKAGMSIGLYRDLAVGVSEGSAEIWSNKDLYCTDVSIGAPPDVLGPLGQKWGLAPIKVEQLKEQQYQSIIDLFSSNMKASGALRIDHILGFLRLWWVPQDSKATQGAYVKYPIEDLLAILALESHRNKSMVIGEDLGTVPDMIRQKLTKNGVFSYKVFFFERAKDGGFYSPHHYAAQSMSALTTHDMPTLKGYWHCDDLVLGKELGLYPDDNKLKDLYDERHRDKQQILDSLHAHGLVGDNIAKDVSWVEMNGELNHSLHLHMAMGSSQLLSLQLEDWLQMDKPVNIPGTFKEYPNWQRKLSHNLEDIFNTDTIANLAHEISERRSQ